MASELDYVAQRYELEEPIASGGMATVWRATDKVLARRVAVKVLHPQLSNDESFLQRFRREALAAARLTHPNIVAIYDTGNDRRRETGDDRHFIVMEYCSGGSLQDVVEREGPLGVERVVDVGTSICDALDYAHRLQIVHRDIKPGNVLVAQDGALKVGDFGIAKAAFASGDITTTGDILGTVTYISPEQARGEEPDARSDLYSLGIVLYQLLLGRPPFAAETQIGTAMKHIQEAPPPPRSIKAGVPKALEAVILKSLAKQPADRYESAAEMRDALQQSISGSRTSVMRAMPTAPARSAPRTQQASATSWGAFRWLVPVLAGVAAIVALAIFLPSLLNNPKDSGRKTGGTTDTQGRGSKQISVESVTSFDPEGDDGSEHQELVNAAIDGQTATAWHTEDYHSALQVNKPGVGLLLDLGASTQVNRVRVTSQAPGYSFELRAADQTGASENSFPIVKKVSAAGATQDVTFSPAAHRFWLLWITALPGGAGGSAYINEIRFFGPSG